MSFNDLWSGSPPKTNHFVTVWSQLVEQSCRRHHNTKFFCRRKMLCFHLSVFVFCCCFSHADRQKTMWKCDNFLQ